MSLFFERVSCAFGGFSENDFACFFSSTVINKTSGCVTRANVCQNRLYMKLINVTSISQSGIWHYEPTQLAKTCFTFITFSGKVPECSTQNFTEPL